MFGPSGISFKELMEGIGIVMVVCFTILVVVMVLGCVVKGVSYIMDHDWFSLYKGVLYVVSCIFSVWLSIKIHSFLFPDKKKRK